MSDVERGWTLFGPAVERILRRSLLDRTIRSTVDLA